LDDTDLHGKALAPYVKNPTTAIPDLVHSWSVSILPSFSPILFSMPLSTKLGEIEEKNLAVGRRAKPRPDFPGQKIPSKLISSVFYEYKTFSSSFAFFTSHVKDQQRREDEQEGGEAAAPTSSSSNFSSQLPPPHQKNTCLLSQLSSHKNEKKIAKKKIQTTTDYNRHNRKGKKLTSSGKIGQRDYYEREEKPARNEVREQIAKSNGGGESSRCGGFGFKRALCRNRGSNSRLHRNPYLPL
jgi:hypothetical protein